MTQLKDCIAKIVADNSGGVKMTQLIVELGPLVVNIGEIEEAISSLPNHHILEYEWKMDDDLYREKRFVYFKL